MPGLDKKDLKILNRAGFTPEQRFQVERYWEKEEKQKNTDFLYTIIGHLLLPSVIVIFLLSQFVSNIGPLVNVAVFLTWVSYGVFVLMSFVLLISVFILKNNQDTHERDKFLGRVFIKILVGSGTIREIYAVVLGCLVILSTVMTGRFLLATFVLFAWMMSKLALFGVKNIIREHLNDISSSYPENIRKVN